MGGKRLPRARSARKGLAQPGNDVGDVEGIEVLGGHPVGAVHDLPRQLCVAHGWSAGRKTRSETVSCFAVAWRADCDEERLTFRGVSLLEGDLDGRDLPGVARVRDIGWLLFDGRVLRRRKRGARWRSTPRRNEPRAGPGEQWHEEPPQGSRGRGIGTARCWVARGHVAVLFLGLQLSCTEYSSPESATVDSAQSSVGTQDDSAGTDSSDSDTAQPVEHCLSADTLSSGLSHAADIQPIWRSECSTCHTTSSNGGLNLADAYDAIVLTPSSDLPSMNLVEPGSPAESYLWLKLSNRHEAASGEGDWMPRGGKLLDDVECLTIQSWIAEGAAP